jgi:hypothetical protein
MHDMEHMIARSRCRTALLGVAVQPRVWVGSSLSSRLSTYSLRVTSRFHLCFRADCANPAESMSAALETVTAQVVPRTMGGNVVSRGRSFSEQAIRTALEDPDLVDLDVDGLHGPASAGTERSRVRVPSCPRSLLRSRCSESPTYRSLIASPRDTCSPMSVSSGS